VTMSNAKLHLDRPVGIYKEMRLFWSASIVIVLSFFPFWLVYDANNAGFFNIQNIHLWCSTSFWRWCSFLVETKTFVLPTLVETRELLVGGPVVRA
jgi:hypothetical protein